MFISIPTKAHRSSYKINIKITPTCFGVLTPSSGSLQVVLAKVMNIKMIKHNTTVVMLKSNNR